MLPGLQNILEKHTTLDRKSLEYNTNRFAADLQRLHEETEQITAPCRGTAVVISHPFFRYYLKRYGFRIIEIIEPHPGKQPTPRTVEILLKSIEENNVQIIMTHPSHTDDIARLLAESADIPICRMDPLGADSRIRNYPDLIRLNTNKILESLNGKAGNSSR
jgi:zinc/manganese transport system substrate-binding protein